jgi:hypothetical protein
MSETRRSTCVHGQQICSKCVVVTDAAKRMSDTVNLHLVCQPWDALKNYWLAFSLADGSSRGDLYDSYKDATRFNDPKRYAIFSFRHAMGGANARDCQLFLDMGRAAAKAGIDWTEPKQDSSQLIIPTRAHDILTRRILP